jgi:glycosyltransferase involved in cell wall biosynthesis
MKILIFSWRGPGHPHEGGAEQVTHEHAKAWVKVGHKVTLFTSYFDGAKVTEVVDGVEIIRKGTQIFGVQIAAFLWYVFGKHPKFDLVVDQFHGIPFFTPLFVRTKILGFIHEVAKDVWKLNPLPFPKNIIPAVVGPIAESLVFRFLYKKTPFLTVSESTKDDLISFGIPEDSISVIHNGVTLNLPKKLPKKEKKYTAVYLGAISRDKGTGDALRVFAEINKKNPNWQFWIIGKGTEDLVDELKVQAVQLSINKKIKFWGFVSDRKKFELLAQAYVLVNPSVREGWGLVNLEANAVGTLVCGYDVPGMRNSVRHRNTGILCPLGDTKKLAENVLELVGDSKVYRKMQTNAKSWAREFTWEKSSKESLKLIENI